MQHDSVVLRVVLRLLAAVALVDVRDSGALARRLLHGPPVAPHLRAVLFVGRRDVEREQVPRRVDRDVHLRALFLLRAVVRAAVSAPMSALRSAAVDDDRRRIRLAAHCDPRNFPKVVHHLREAAGLDPALDLLVDGGPRRKVVRDHAPRCVRAYDPAAGVVYLAEIVLLLRRVLADQREIRRDELLLVILDSR